MSYLKFTIREVLLITALFAGIVFFFVQRTPPHPQSDFFRTFDVRQEFVVIGKKLDEQILMKQASLGNAGIGGRHREPIDVQVNVFESSPAIRKKFMAMLLERIQHQLEASDCELQPVIVDESFSGDDFTCFTLDYRFEDHTLGRLRCYSYDTDDGDDDDEAATWQFVLTAREW